MRVTEPGHDTLEGIVRDDPSELTARIEQIHRGLHADDLPTRRDAGRAIRVVATHDPERLESHLDMVVGLLSDGSGSVRLSGAVGLRELAAIAPTTVAEVVPELLALLEDADAPAIQLAAIRALSHVGEHSPGAVAVADDITADLLRTATTPIRAAIVTIFAGAVVENPSHFPETVGAMEHGLDDDAERVRRYAAEAVAAVATADRSAVSSVAAVTERVEAMEDRVTAQPWHADENVEHAADTLRALGDDAPD